MSATASPTDSNPFASLISQPIHVLTSFTFESGVTLPNVPVAYKTWGRLNASCDNVLVICHALTGSADVEDWWGPLLGVDRAFDPTRWFIFCGNVIGSPYGTVSSVSGKGGEGIWGPEMPGSSPKDDVRLHYEVLKHLGVRSIAAVIGGSMGGMTCLEYPLNTPPGFVRHIVPLATSARHSAWCISWGEAERQSIYSDPDYKDGYYYETHPGGESSGSTTIDLHRQPTRGLAAARMAALLTYRSRDSFEARFGRRAGGPKKSVPKGGIRIMGGAETTDPNQPGEADKDWENNEASRQGEKAWREHNDGHRPVGVRRGSGASVNSAGSAGGNGSGDGEGQGTAQDKPKLGTGAGSAGENGQKVFSAQSYLRYQGDKFTARFDANCYIHLTRKMDAHDLSHPSTISTCTPPSLSSLLPPLPSASSFASAEEDDAALQAALHHALSLLPPALVIGIESDGLFTTSEQRELAAHIPESELVVIPSPDGHDGFLLEFEAINGWIEGWLRRKVPEYYGERVIEVEEYGKGEDGWGVKKESVFGEAEADVTAW